MPRQRSRGPAAGSSTTSRGGRIDKESDLRPTSLEGPVRCRTAPPRGTPPKLCGATESKRRPPTTKTLVHGYVGVLRNGHNSLAELRGLDQPVPAAAPAPELRGRSPCDHHRTAGPSPRPRVVAIPRWSVQRRRWIAGPPWNGVRPDATPFAHIDHSDLVTITGHLLPRRASRAGALVAAPRWITDLKTDGRARSRSRSPR